MLKAKQNINKLKGEQALSYSSSSLFISTDLRPLSIFKSLEKGQDKKFPQNKVQRELKEDDGSDYECGSTIYHRKEKIGSGVTSIVHVAVSDEGKKRASIRPVRCALIRLSKEPYKFSKEELKGVLKYRSAFAIHNTKSYYIDRDLKITPLDCTDFDDLNMLFPNALDKLVREPNKVLEQILIHTKALSNNSIMIGNVNWEELQTKFRFYKCLFPLEEIVWFRIGDNDYRLIVPFIEGVPYHQLKISDALEQIKIFSSAVDAIWRCHNLPCSLISLNSSLETFPNEDLKRLLANQAAYVLTRSEDNRLLYYFNPNLKKFPLYVKDFTKLQSFFSEGPKKLATKAELEEISFLTDHQHLGLVFIDLKSDNIIYNKLTGASDIIDGGDSLFEYEFLPSKFSCKTAEILSYYQKKYSHIAEECFHLNGRTPRAFRAMDVFSLAKLMEEILESTLPELAYLIELCKKKNPKLRPTLEFIKDYLVNLDLIYTIKHEIRSFMIDFSKLLEPIEYRRDSLVSRLNLIIDSPRLKLSLQKMCSTLELSGLSAVYMAKIKEINVEYAKLLSVSTIPKSSRAYINNAMFKTLKPELANTGSSLNNDYN